MHGCPASPLPWYVYALFSSLSPIYQVPYVGRVEKMRCGGGVQKTEANQGGRRVRSGGNVHAARSRPALEECTGELAVQHVRALALH